MRLGIVIDEFREERGGAEKYLARLARELVARGHDVAAYCLRGHASHPGVRVRLVRPGHGWRGRRERAFATEAVTQARAEGCLVLGVRHAVDVDVYQPHGGTWAATAAARHRQRTWPQRCLGRLWRPWSSRQRYFRWADEQVFARRPGLLTLAMSPMVKADVESRHARYHPRVEVVWPAIDPFPSRPTRDPRERWQLDKAAPLVLFAAHNFALKGLPALLDSLPRSQAIAEGGQVVVAGRDAAAPYRRAAKLRGLAAQVHFVGGEEQVCDWLAVADVLVHPTCYDPCALICLEALAAGLGVITTPANGAAPLVEAGQGRIVDLDAGSAALAAAIDAALYHREEARAAAPQAVAHLNWARHTDRMEELLESESRRR